MANFYEYPKIETVYNRDTTGSKLLIENSFRNPIIEMLASYPIFSAYEKLDGTNMGIYWDGHSINLQGRTEKSNIPVPVQEYFDSKFNNNETEELFEQLFDNKQYVLYFEAIGNKIQPYGKFYGDSPRFVLIDVYNVRNNSWWRYGSSGDTLPNEFTINSLAKALNVECKQLVMVGSIKDIIEYVKTIPLSTFTKEGLEFPMEGLVVLPNLELKDSNGDRIIVKIKGKDHVKNFENLLKKFKFN